MKTLRFNDTDIIITQIIALRLDSNYEKTYHTIQLFGGIGINSIGFNKSYEIEEEAQAEYARILKEIHDA